MINPKHIWINFSITLKLIYAQVQKKKNWESLYMRTFTNLEPIIVMFIGAIVPHYLAPVRPPTKIKFRAQDVHSLV